MTESTKSQTVLDLESARRNSTLNVALVREFLHGGEGAWKSHERVVRVLSSEPVFDKSYKYHATKEESYLKALSMQKRIEELRVLNNWDATDMSFVQAALDEPLPIGLHKMAFEPVITSQGSDELKNRFLALIQSNGIIGCYLQTELGHGTNVAQLETTAVYLPDTEEFEINSPTLTSTKWWIGALGKTATHGVVQARLILPGNKDMGPHLFLIQLRSLDNHKVLPGIKIGDIGPKAMAGFPAVDNGFARFDHLRVPRVNMLSKFSQVTKEGGYVKPPHAKLNYGGMLYIRAGMVSSSARALAKSITIALRYATIRRQGNNQGGLERQVIQYPSVHRRLLPILSRAYVYMLLGGNMLKKYSNLSEELSRGVTASLPELHAITSGLKVLVTTSTIEDIEVARRSMGGHGYSAYAAVGKIYADIVPSATFEGDNYVLDQQVVRAALKSYTSFSSSDNYSPFSSYLRLLKTKSSDQIVNRETPDWKDWKVLINTLEWRAARSIEYQQKAREAGILDSSCDQRLSRAVTEAYVATQVGDMIFSVSGARLGKSERVVQDLLTLYLLSTVESSVADLLSLRIIRPGTGEDFDAINSLRHEFTSSLRDLVPEAISLSDSFGYSDWELDSVLGVYDGNVYEALWDKVQHEPLNQTEVPRGYEEYIKPMLDNGRKLAQERSGMIKTKL